MDIRKWWNAPTPRRTFTPYRIMGLFLLFIGSFGGMVGYLKHGEHGYLVQFGSTVDDQGTITAPYNRGGNPQGSVDAWCRAINTDSPDAAFQAHLEEKRTSAAYLEKC